MAETTEKAAALSEALEKIASQKLPKELEDEFGEDSHPDFEGGYEAIIKIARAVLSETKPAQGDRDIRI